MNIRAKLITLIIALSITYLFAMAGFFLSNNFIRNVNRSVIEVQQIKAKFEMVKSKSKDLILRSYKDSYIILNDDMENFDSYLNTILQSKEIKKWVYKDDIDSVLIIWTSILRNHRKIKTISETEIFPFLQENTFISEAAFIMLEGLNQINITEYETFNRSLKGVYREVNNFIYNESFVRSIDRVIIQVEKSAERVVLLYNILFYASVLAIMFFSILLVNISLKRIKHMTDTIELYSKNMEKQVLERTADLQAANLVMKEDLAMAQKVQFAMLPTDFSKIDGCDLTGYYLPMQKLGGDFYDVIKISEDKIAFVIADVCGHGVPAALVSALAKMAFINNSKSGEKITEIIKKVNNELYNIIGTTSSLTAFYCIIDMKNNIIEYINASHPDIYIMRNKKELLRLPGTAPMIGLKKDLEFKSQKRDIKENDRLILYTDGIIEARNDQRVIFGELRFESLICDNVLLEAKEMVDVVIQKLNSFCNSNTFNDDVTILVVDVLHNRENLKINLGAYSQKSSINKQAQV